MKITIIGASGHGKVVADIANRIGYNEIEFLDDDPSLSAFCGKWPIIGNTERVNEIKNDFFIAVGNPKIRKMLMEKYSGKNFVTLIHPDAVVAAGASIDFGTVIMAGAVINPSVSIGKGCIINTSSSIDHDCVVRDYCHVAVGSHIAGTVTVGAGTWIGAGTIVSNNINICSNCMIGAGAVIVKDITEPGTYVGVPARKIK